MVSGAWVETLSPEEVEVLSGLHQQATGVSTAMFYLQSTALCFYKDDVCSEDTRIS